MSKIETREKPRLGDKVAVLTGGGGGIGRVVAKRYLEEGAKIVLTGRTLEKLKTAATELEAENPSAKGRIQCVAMDGSNPASLKKGAAEIAAKFGGVDILINNAGSAGPRQELANIPLTRSELERLRASGSQDTETLTDAVGSLLGSPWYTSQALLPHFNKGASIINVSTIFSRTEYYGRIAYVVPKAALNTLTRFMAAELGRDKRAIRVNTVYPGPVESERIHSVFATMDKLKGVPPGTTGKEIVGSMLLQNSPTGANYVSKEEVANTIVFLGSDEGTSYSGHDFEVTHGIQWPKDSYTHVISRPNLRVVDLEGRLVWIIAGDQLEDACQLAEKHHEMGADIFLTFRDPKTLAAARTRLEDKPGYTLDLLDPLDPEHWHKADTTLYLKHQLPRSTIVLPSFGPTTGDYFGPSIMEAGPAKVQEFFDREICGAITVAQRLDQIFNASDKRLTSDPVVVFMSNGSDGKGDAFANVRRSAIEQLIRIWRHENQLIVKGGRRSRRIRVNQLVRFENQEAINLDLACEWAISLSNGLRQVRAIDVSLAPSLAGSIQSRVALNWERQALRGLHLRKVALITGGSEGIGGETARLLALAGARVAIAARSLEKLEKARQMLIEELKMAGYSDPESRILIIPDCDVADEKALETMVDQTLVRFGRIDYLINNAGIAGAEQMVADMPLDSWNRTLMANLVSNYDLIERVLPHMKKQKSGHILNVSSHFGGVRHATVAYPNRSDYAVSKAGQRAMAEVLAAILGPDVQINSVAPGPVDGVRLRGTSDRPGLYMRRAKLILENKRMNLVYGALVTAFRCGEKLDAAMSAIAKNEIKPLAEDKTVPESVRALARTLLEKPPKETCGSATHLLTRPLAQKLLDRMRTGMFLPLGFQNDRFMAAFNDPPEPFLPKSQIDADAASIRNSVLSTLALQRMPSENDVAREMVFYLANRNVTGETLHPSCGLMLDRLTMSGDFVGRAHPDLLAELRGQTIFILGDSMHEEMAQLASAYIRSGAKQVAIVTCSDSGRKVVDARLEAIGSAKSTALLVTSDAASAPETLDKMIAKFGPPNVVVSFPLSTLTVGATRGRSGWENLPTTAHFKNIVRDQITNHLLVGRRASLIDSSNGGCRVVFVTPRLPAGANPATVAMANFVRTTLRPLTVTAGQEGGRLIHKPVFNQIDLAGESTRFLEAVLLMSLPQSANGAASNETKSGSGATITV